MNYNCLKMTNLYLTYCCEMIFNFIVLFQLCHDNTPAAIKIVNDKIYFILGNDAIL